MSNWRRGVSLGHTCSCSRPTGWGSSAGSSTNGATASARRAEELLALVARRKQRIAEDFYEIGTALREIERKKLYVALGYRSFAALLDKRDVMSERTARKLIEIVEAVPRGRALELGSEKAYALARLAAATPDVDDVDDLLTKGVRVRGKKRSVAELSSEKIAAVAREVRPKKRAEGEREAKSAARTLQTTLRSRGARHLEAEAIRRGTEWHVRIDVPLTEASVLTRARR